MRPNDNLGPKDLLYKEVVDADGESLGKVINITQNGNGFFEIFGVEMCQEAAEKVNGACASIGGHLFLNVDIIDTVDKMVRLKNSLDDLKDLNGLQ